MMASSAELELWKRLRTLTVIRSTLPWLPAHEQ
jgi:hypothetical protein